MQIEARRIDESSETSAKSTTFYEWYAKGTNGPWSWQFDEELTFQNILQMTWDAAQENKS